MSQTQLARKSSSKKLEVSCDASTEEKSTLYLKQMMSLTISHVTYLRGIFEGAAFRDRYIGNMKIKMIRENKKDENITLLIDWMKGCFDALEKKYLKQVTLTIHNPDNPRDEPIESYTFLVSYLEDRTASVSMQRNGVDVTESAYSEKGIKEASVNCLMELCSVIDVLDVLPDEVVLNMELAYYDERTPKDYEPRGFRPAANKARRDDKLEVGVVETKFHRLRLNVYTREAGQKASETSLVSLLDKSRLLLPEARVSPIVGDTAMETTPPPATVATSPLSTVDYSRKCNSTWEGVEGAAPGEAATPNEELVVAEAEAATTTPAGRRTTRKSKRKNSPERNAESATSLKRRRK